MACTVYWYLLALSLYTIIFPISFISFFCSIYSRRAILSMCSFMAFGVSFVFFFTFALSSTRRNFSLGNITTNTKTDASFWARGGERGAGSYRKCSTFVPPPHQIKTWAGFLHRAAPGGNYSFFLAMRGNTSPTQSAGFSPRGGPTEDAWRAEMNLLAFPPTPALLNAAFFIFFFIPFSLPL